MPTRRKQMIQAAIEIGFIIFLFYSNLLMGEFTHSSARHTLLFAVHDIVTWANFGIAAGAAIIGHAVFEFLRRRLLWS